MKFAFFLSVLVCSAKDKNAMATVSFNPNVSPAGVDASDPSCRASSVSVQDTEFFESKLSAKPQTSFETLFDSLDSIDQQKIDQSLESFDKATKNSLAACNEAIDAIPTDLTDEAQTKNFDAKNQIARDLVSNAVDSGLKLLETLRNVDPALLESSPIPDTGASIFSLMITNGTYPDANLNGLAKYFSISPELILQTLKTNGGNADQLAQAAKAFGLPVPA